MFLSLRCHRDISDDMSWTIFILPRNVWAAIAAVCSFGGTQCRSTEVERSQGDQSSSLMNQCTVIIQSTVVFGANDLSLSPIFDHVSVSIGLRVYEAMFLLKSSLTVYTTMNPTRHGDIAIQWWQQTSTKTIATREGISNKPFSKFVQRLTCRFFYFSAL